MGLEDLTRILDPGPLERGWGDYGCSQAKREKMAWMDPCCPNKLQDNQELVKITSDTVQNPLKA